MGQGGRIYVTDEFNHQEVANVRGRRLWVDAILAAGTGPILVEQPVHDLLNCNANAQHGNADVSVVNALPVTITDNASGLTAAVVVDGILGFRALAVTSVVRISNVTTGLDPAFVAGAVRTDVPSTVPQANGTYTNIRTDSFGRLRVTMGENITTEVLTGGAADGTPIAIPVAGPTTIHTVPAAPVIRDRITIFCSNPNTADDALFLTFGGGTPLEFFLPAAETVSIVIDMPLDPGLVVTAVTATATCDVFGRVERVNP
jgi:hypothetical protein